MILGVYSNGQLDTCHPKLQKLIRETVKRLTRHSKFDFTVLCGHRGRAAQEQAYAEKKSTKEWPDSLHNRLPSPAVDIAPYPIDWNDTARFARLAGYIQAVADELDIQIRWGGDWDGDTRTNDEKFVDMPHFELTQWELNRP
jgi:peptidoglycan L-alanyl-D-glutamate endopeptidase CwlK